MNSARHGSSDAVRKAAKAAGATCQRDAASDFLTRARAVALSVGESNRTRHVDEIEKAQTLVNSAR